MLNEFWHLDIFLITRLNGFFWSKYGHWRHKWVKYFLFYLQFVGNCEENFFHKKISAVIFYQIKYIFPSIFLFLHVFYFNILDR